MAAEDVKKWVYRSRGDGSAGHPHHNYILTWRDGKTLWWSGFDTFRGPEDGWRHREWNGSIDGTMREIHRELPDIGYAVTPWGDGFEVHPDHHVLHAQAERQEGEPVQIEDGLTLVKLVIDAYGKPWEHGRTH